MTHLKNQTAIYEKNLYYIMKNNILHHMLLWVWFCSS